MGIIEVVPNSLGRNAMKLMLALALALFFAPQANFGGNDRYREQFAAVVKKIDDKPLTPHAKQRDPEEVFRKACERLVALEAKHDILKGLSKVKPSVEREENGRLKSARLVFENNAVPPGKEVAKAKDDSKPFAFVSVSVWSGSSQQPPANLHEFVWKGQTYQMLVQVFGSNAELVKAVQATFIDPLLAPETAQPRLTLSRTDLLQSKTQHLVFQGVGTVPIHRVGPEHFKIIRVEDGNEIDLVVAYSRGELDKRVGQEVVKPSEKEKLPFNSLFKGVRFQLDNGPYDAKDLPHEAGNLDLYGRAKLELGVRYRLIWVCWPVGAPKGSETSCDFVLTK
jgi:hypothetical protein